MIKKKRSRKTPISDNPYKSKQAHSITISNLPRVANDAINMEQSRMVVEENLSLKKPVIASKMLGEWSMQKKMIKQMQEYINTLEKALQEAST